MRRFRPDATSITLIVFALVMVLLVIKCINLAAAVQAEATSSAHNRVSNVATWCNAINSDRTYNREFVAHVTHGQGLYLLHNLNCVALERKTVTSTR